MADAVSKLYAEIGFKINQDGLKQAQKIIKGLAKEMSAISNATKEAAKQYGIFSKDRNKQAMADAKLATEHEKAENLRNKRRIDNAKMALKTSIALKKMELQEEKKINREKLKESRNFFNAAKNIFSNLNRIRKSAFGLAGYGWLATKTGLKFMEPSIERAYDFQNFSFESGMSLADFQKQQRAFAAAGVRVSAQDLMQDMITVQRNLTNVALNRGGDLAAYKLTDVRAGALRGDLNAVLEGIQKALQDGRIDNSMLVQILDMFGFGHSVGWARRITSKPADSSRVAETMLSEGQRGEINDAFVAINRTAFALENLRDQITWALSPTLQSFSEGLKKWFEELSLSIKKGDFDQLFSAIKKGADELLGWIANPENIKSVLLSIKDGAKALVDGAKKFTQIMDSIGEKLGLYKEVAKNAAIGGAAGAVSGGIMGTFAGGPIGGAIGATIGALGAGYGVGKLTAWEYGKKAPNTMSDVISSYANSPIHSAIQGYTNITNNINTILNGLDDEEKKKEFEDIINQKVETDKRMHDRLFIRDNNILFLNGESN